MNREELVKKLNDILMRFGVYSVGKCRDEILSLLQPVETLGEGSLVIRKSDIIGYPSCDLVTIKASAIKEALANKIPKAEEKKCEHNDFINGQCVKCGKYLKPQDKIEPPPQKTPTFTEDDFLVEEKPQVSLEIEFEYGEGMLCTQIKKIKIPREIINHLNKREG